jgi:hypothetical protein
VEKQGPKENIEKRTNAKALEIYIPHEPIVTRSIKSVSSRRKRNPE